MPRRCGHFVKEYRCACPNSQPNSQLRAIMFNKVECYANNNRPTEMSDLASPVERNNTDAVLEVLCKCSACGHEVHVTHEFMGPGEFSNEFGRYNNICSSTVLTGISTTAYEDIGNVFSDMGRTGHGYESCKCWTNDLIKRLLHLSKMVNTSAYEDTDNLFSDMSTDQNVVYKNCKRWTTDLLKRLRITNHHK
uniref:Uncharacterized protein n=1 Tax=Globodera rostochiensis TaxID=31243 RepID=A0A914H6X3_GLORO